MCISREIVGPCCFLQVAYQRQEGGLLVSFLRQVFNSAQYEHTVVYITYHGLSLLSPMCASSSFMPLIPGCDVLILSNSVN